MPQLRLFLLGTFELYLDELPITKLYSDKTRALLAYLALEADQPHTRGELATLLWPDTEEKRAKQNLRQVLSQLQKSIDNQTAEPPYLLVTRHTVQFNRRADHWLDVAAVRHGDVDHYRGSLLTHFVLDDSNLFDEWLTIQREALHREVLMMLSELGEKTAALDAVQAAAYAQRQTELDPWREEGYRQWMRYLYLAGRPHDAVQVYEQCRGLLMRELGVEPEPETDALLAEIQFQRTAEDTESLPPSPPTPNLRPSTLPREKTPLIGRTTELAEIHTLLADPTCRLLTLIGLGGAGKTRLAISAAKQVTENAAAYPDGVWFVSLIGAESMFPAVARTLNFPFSGNQPPEQQLCDYLADKQMLLVLDNCEELLHEGEWLTELITAAPQLDLLTTARQPFDLPAEWLFTVEGLSTHPHTAEQSDAEALFLAAAQRANARYQPSDEDRPLIQQICQQVLGHPLSIELAASWIRLLSVAEIAAEISQTDTIFATDSKQIEARHRNLSAVFDYTWQTLTPQEQATMGKLAVFRAGFTREAAQRVAGASLLNLLQLVNKALVQRQGDRFGLHEAVRQYATSKAAALPHHTHAQEYTTLLTNLRHSLHTRLDPQPLETITAELENIRAAWAWFTDHDPLALAPAVDSWTLYVERAGLILEAEEQYSQLCQQLSAEEQEAAALRTKLLNIRTHWLINLNREEESRPLIEEALQLAEQYQLLTEQAMAHTNLGIYRFVYRQVDACHAAYQTSLEHAKTSGNPATLTLCQERYGRTLENIGHYQEAFEMLHAAVVSAEKLGRVDISTRLYERLTYVHLNAGDYGEMSRYAHLYARAAEKMGTDQTIAAANYLLGLFYDVTGQTWEAIAYYRTALTLFNRYNIGRRQVTTAIHLASVYQKVGEYKLAEELYFQVDVWLSQGKSKLSHATVRMMLANLYTDMGLFDKAFEYAGKSLRHVDWHAPTAQSMQYLMHMGRLLLLDGRMAEAAAFICYGLQSPLTRDSHRTIFAELKTQLPPEIWVTATQSPPNLTQLHQLAQKNFLQ